MSNDSSTILTPKQQKKTLSAKKKARKRSLRSILATPYKNYWPIVDSEDNNIITKILELHLTKVVKPKVKVPWNELKNVPTEKRKEFRLQYTKVENAQPLGSRTDIVFGVNETTKLLEKGQASSILITEDVNPRLIVKHVLDMAVLQNTPVLVLPNLKDILSMYTGISSIAVAFKINSDVVSNYQMIDRKIKELSVKYPPPSDHVNLHRRSELVDIEMNETTLPKINSEDKLEVPQNLYLYRNNKSSRIFVPELSKEQPTYNIIGKMGEDKCDFISLDTRNLNSSQQTANFKLKNKSKISYKSLLIKQVINNCNRDKEKIQLLKRKK